MMHGCDFYARQSPAVIACLAQQFRFVVRYYDPNVVGKCLTHDEVGELSRAGLRIHAVYETDGQDIRTGQGALAASLARAAGQPAGSPIYHAIDREVDDSEIETLVARAKALALEDATYRHGIYGEYRLCRAALAAGLPAWQTYAWSGDEVAAGIDLYQYANGQYVCGVQVDLDEGFVEGWRIEEGDEMDRTTFDEWFRQNYLAYGVAAKFDALVATEANLNGRLTELERHDHTTSNGTPRNPVTGAAISPPDREPDRDK